MENTSYLYDSARSRLWMKNRRIGIRYCITKDKHIREPNNQKLKRVFSMKAAHVHVEQPCRTQIKCM